MLPQQIERSPDGLGRRLPRREVAVEALSHAERGIDETASGHPERPVAGRRHALGERVEALRQHVAVTAGVVAGDGDRSEERGVRGQRPVRRGDAFFGPETLAKVAVEVRRGREPVAVRPHAIGPQRIDQEQDDRARRAPRGNLERRLRKKNRAVVGPASPASYASSSSRGRADLRQLDREPVPARRIRGELQEAGPRGALRAGDTDSKLPCGIAREEARVAAREAARGAGRERPPHGIPGREPDAGPGLRSDADPLGLGHRKADDSARTVRAREGSRGDRKRERHRGGAPSSAASTVSALRVHPQRLDRTLSLALRRATGMTKRIEVSRGENAAILLSTRPAARPAFWTSSHM